MLCEVVPAVITQGDAALGVHNNKPVSVQIHNSTYNICKHHSVMQNIKAKGMCLCLIGKAMHLQFTNCRLRNVWHGAEAPCTSNLELECSRTWSLPSLDLQIVNTAPAPTVNEIFLV